ncbi:VOC family protein [Streptomyces cadmiisoli]|uniref:VOC family protein n=1 Tax=Streptomyces cadmiisoli TaxID=2184053 RepID=UPI0018F05783|nr:VOC family protein [Streptomyces cadmiisoli]
MSNREEVTVSLRASAVMLGVKDVNRARKFYVDGLGCDVDQEFPGFVRCSLGEGSSMPALHEREAAAQDAGVPAEGSGFRGVSFHFITDSRDEVDEVMRSARAAGGTVVKPAAAAEWGGYFGYFSDPDGHLWKVTTAT